MILTRIRWELAVVVILAVVCVGVTFFFPVVQGPYSAVNGPVTALQSARAAARVRVAIILAASSLIGNMQTPLLACLNPTTVECIEPQAPQCFVCSTILRC